jgi:nucleotide-binding universal stress UspA family protein
LAHAIIDASMVAGVVPTEAGTLMLILEQAAVAPQTGIDASPERPVIIATDGRGQTDSAMNIGRLLAGDCRAMRIITVLKPVPMTSGGEAPLPITPDVEAERRALHRRAVLDQGFRIWNEPTDVELAEGDPASTLSLIAHESNARMIVSGVGRHNISDRMFGDETAIRLIRVADVPILAVARGLEDAPGCILVAIDYSESSISAARLAMQIAAPGATILLAHVVPADSSRRQSDSRRREADRLQQLRDRLVVPKGMSVHLVVPEGDATTQLLALAEHAGCDLIATGSRGCGFVARLFKSSVATQLLRASVCSVLCVPHFAVQRCESAAIT